MVELRSVLERAVILSTGNHLRLDLVLPMGNRAGATDDSADGEFLTHAEFRQKERKNILGALQHAGWRISGSGGAADLLGVKASTLTYRMKKLKIERE